jgi:hypothetical protein
MLAPLHRRAALRRAAEACGHAGAFPSLADLATAEAPPQAEWKMTGYDAPPLPTRTAVEAEAARVLRDVAWRAALPLMPPGEVKRRARGVATDRLTAAWQRGPQASYECVNPDAVAEGGRLAADHGPLLSALGALLHGLDEAIPRSQLAALADEDVRLEADRRAEAAQAHWAWRVRLAQSAGRPAQVITAHDRRMQCPRDHRRRIRREAGQVRQHLAAALGTVGRGAAPYADDYSLARWTERQDAAAAWAETHALTGADGTAVPMSRMIAASHDAQRARLYAMMLGVDGLAQRMDIGVDEADEPLKMTPIFLTLTLPPEWHPSPKVGNRTWTPDRAPHLADAALRRMWARFRALLADRDIATLGLRVWEPHRDGCPHAHALLYVEPGQVEAVDDALQTVCPELGPGRRVASKLVVVDRKRASPATYIAKYILKTCAGGPAEEERAAAMGADDDTDDQLAHYERHRATASERGWRRFAWLGVHGVQRVWQRLLTTEHLPEDAPPRVRMAWYALQDGRWADALEALGAVGLRGQGVRLAYATDEEHVDKETGEVTRRPLLTAYGEPARKPVAVEDRATGWSMPLARQKWTIAKAEGGKSNENNGLTVADRVPRAGKARTAGPVQASALEPVAMQKGLAGPLPAACGPPRRSQRRQEYHKARIAEAA